MQAMILAAGFGTRLLPYTKIRPKPLFPLLNEPLLLLTIKRLQNAGFDHIIVNCHYLKEQIVEALDGLKGVVIQEEDIVLGTGGGLRMALRLMRDEPLLVTNGDIYHSIDYRDLYSHHERGDASVTMAMHNYPRFNKVKVAGDRVIGFSAEDGEPCMAFTGLHVLDPEILGLIPEEEKYCIVDRYRALLANDESIQALDVTGCSWTDMGTVEDYLALHGQLLKREIDLWAEFRHAPQGTCLCFEEQTSFPVYHDWACVGRVALPQKVIFERCVVWDEACLEEGQKYSDILLT